jgi:hypothetical protein
MRNKTIAIKQSDTTVDLLGNCILCKEAFSLNVRVDAYVRWVNGESVQSAFSEISRENRELLISGTCGECWLKMFGTGPVVAGMASDPA